VKLEQLRAMPDEGLIPVKLARQALEEVISDRVSLAVQRQLTIQMWCDICTRGIQDTDTNRDGEWDGNRNGTGGAGPTASERKA
jgi:hypothetical protein